MTILMGKLLMILSGTVMYWAGEIYKKELKYAMGIPIGILGAIVAHSWFPLIAVISYFIATEFGYGDNNPLTKLLGKRGAITFCGIVLGIASFPIIGYWCILQGLIGGVAFYYISVLDDADKLKEPWVAICRGLCGTILLIV